MTAEAPAAAPPAPDYSRTGIVFAGVGSESGFGERVAPYTPGQIPFQANTAFSHASKLGYVTHEAITNLCTYSWSLNTWPTKTLITTTKNYDEAPDGSENSSRCVAGTGASKYIQSATYAVTAMDATIVSLWIRRSQGTDVTGNLHIWDVTGDAAEATAAFTATADWQRIQVYSASAASAAQAVRIEIDSNSDAIEVWGVQAEISLEGDYPVSVYVPTTSAAAACASNFMQLASAFEEGYVMHDRGEVEVTHVYHGRDNDEQRIAARAAASGNNDRFYIISRAADNQPQLGIWSGSGVSEQFWVGGGAHALDTEYLERLRWDAAAGVDGNAETADYVRGTTRVSSGDAGTWTPGAEDTILFFGCDVGGAGPSSAIISRVRVFDEYRSETP